MLGAANGIKGVLEGKLYDMGMEDPVELELLTLFSRLPFSINSLMGVKSTLALTVCSGRWLLLIVSNSSNIAMMIELFSCILFCF